MRLGYADPGPDSGGAWIVLYCLGTSTDDARQGERQDDGAPGEPLGPVWYALEGPGCPKMLRARLGRVAFAQTIRREPFLWCAALPLSAETARTLTVLGTADRVLAKHTFEKPTEARPHLWHTFAAHHRRTTVAEPGTFVTDHPDAARPKYGERLVLAGQVGDDEAPVLPGAAGPGEADGLKLSLDGDAFVVITAGRPMIDRPVRKLLARWWVNGKPVIAPSAERPLADAGDGQQRQTGEFRVRFDVPDHLGKLKPGDRVALQVLYSPAGFDRLTVDAAKQQMLLQLQRDDNRPLLSNRLEFELTEELLRQADRSQPDD